MDEDSQKLCLISRQKLHDVRSSLRVTPITAHIQSRLAIRMRNQDIEQLMEIEQYFDRHPFAKGLSGYLFEIFGHLQLQKQIVIEYAPMVRLSSDNWKNQALWHSSYLIHKEEN